MAAICPITLQPLAADETPPYSRAGLRRLHPRLRRLNPLAFTAGQQLEEAAARSHKMSIQGVQPKLSAVLKLTDAGFEIVDSGGRFILKPCPPGYAQVPENEALTMSLAATCGIEVPDHGLVAAADGTWTYWVRRFDRTGRSDKRPLEDFAQLQGRTRDTKYESSMEQVAAMIERHATFPAVEKRRLALRTLFCFLTGNEDMHLKNFSLLTEPAGQIVLSPAYDLLNTSIVLRDPAEEMALPLRGKKRHLTRHDLVRYFCGERCGLPDKAVEELLAALWTASRAWPDTIGRSFLAESRRRAYLALLEERLARLFGA